MGYLDPFSSKMLFIFKFKACIRHNDIIMGNMEGLVTLVFFKKKRTNLASWGSSMQIFQKVIFSKFKASMTSV